MIVYKALFFLIYRFFQSVRGEFITYTDDLIAFKVMIILSILPIINLSSFYVDISIEQRLLIFGTLTALNYLIFVFKGNYKLIEHKFRLLPPNFVIRFVGLSYLILTLAIYFLYR